MKERYQWLAGMAVLGACLAAGCEDDEDASGMDGGVAMDGSIADHLDGSKYDSAVYGSMDAWLCHPQMAASPCGAFPGATEVYADKTLGEVDAGPGRDALDCFYVYPTIDLAQESGLTTDFANIEDIREAARSQAAPFAGSCRVYAPLYHQLKLGSYFDGRTRDVLLEKAYAEVEDAFQHYLSHFNDDRQIVFIGHSQGTHLLRRLLQRRFDGACNRELRKKLNLALLIGALGDLTVFPGRRIGSTFQTIPACSAPDEVGCVISYNSYPATKPPDRNYGAFVGGVPSGLEAMCTNPASLSGGKAPSAGAFMPTNAKGVAAGTLIDFAQTYGVTTYFTLFRQFYGLECKPSAFGQPYLAVTTEPATGDLRTDPIRYDAPGLSVDLVGLHVLDYNLALDDLVKLVRDRVP